MEPPNNRFPKDARSQDICPRSLNARSRLSETKGPNILSELDSGYAKAVKLLKVQALVPLPKVYTSTSIQVQLWALPIQGIKTAIKGKN